MRPNAAGSQGSSLLYPDHVLSPLTAVHLHVEMVAKSPRLMLTDKMRSLLQDLETLRHVSRLALNLRMAGPTRSIFPACGVIMATRSTLLSWAIVLSSQCYNLR